MLKKKSIKVINIILSLSDVLDLVSPSLSKHQQRAAYISWQIAKTAKLPIDLMEKIFIAALLHDIGALSPEEKINLHDIGKLIVPNKILEKPAKLTKKEFAEMRQHSYFSYSGINTIKGLEQIASWAAFHHEKLDGSG